MKGRSLLESSLTALRNISSSLLCLWNIPVLGWALRTRIPPELLSQLRAGIRHFDLWHVGLVRDYKLMRNDVNFNFCKFCQTLNERGIVSLIYLCRFVCFWDWNGLTTPSRQWHMKLRYNDNFTAVKSYWKLKRKFT